MVISNLAMTPLFDIDPRTDATIDVFYADRALETFGRRGFSPSGLGPVCQELRSMSPRDDYAGTDHLSLTRPLTHSNREAHRAAKTKTGRLPLIGDHRMHSWNLTGTFWECRGQRLAAILQNIYKIQYVTWYSWVGSNHRPPVPQTGALTN